MVTEYTFLQSYVIVVVERTEDCIAYQQGHPEKWERGNTHSDAIGQLIITLSTKNPKD